MFKIFVVYHSMNVINNYILKLGGKNEVSSRVSDEMIRCVICTNKKTMKSDDQMNATNTNTYEHTAHAHCFLGEIELPTAKLNTKLNGTTMKLQQIGKMVNYWEINQLTFSILLFCSGDAQISSMSREKVFSQWRPHECRLHRFDASIAVCHVRELKGKFVISFSRRFSSSYLLFR